MERIRRKRLVVSEGAGVDLVGQIAGRDRAEKGESPVEFLHSGSHVLNLAASGRARGGGWARNRIINLVGDGSSGKTLLALETCAQAFYYVMDWKSRIFPPVTKVNVVYDNREGVMDFPIEKMYGKRFVKGVEWIQSETCEEFGRGFARRVTGLVPGEFLLYVADSLDAMVSKAAKDRIDKSIKADKETEDSYGTEKAKYFSAEFFNDLCGRMKNKDATLICISQLRQNIGVTFGEKYHRAGGSALNFYTHQVAWLREAMKLKRTFRGKEMAYGVRVHAKFKRNKTAIPFREAEFSILFSYGMDDIGSMIDYLYGPKDKAMDFAGRSFTCRADLISYLEQDKRDNGTEVDKLIDLVEQDWREIEEEIGPKRMARFE